MNTKVVIAIFLTGFFRLNGMAQKELQHFLAQPLWQTVYGKSLGNVNHVAGFNLSILKHETGHIVIDNTIGKNTNSFWQEGFRQYTDYLFSREAYQNDLNLTLEHIDLLTPQLIRNHSSIYFTNWDNYPISGIFTKFLIDKIGFEIFIAIYGQNNIEKYLESTGSSIETLLTEFKNSLIL